MANPLINCELCASSGGDLLWNSPLCRVVYIADSDYPGFCRVILNRHEREMSDLPEVEQRAMMRVVFAVEATLRRLINPDKINLASLGNMTPHVHWHIIPRWKEDRCFPNPIWGTAQRTNAATHTMIDTNHLGSELARLLGAATSVSDNCLP